MAKSSIVNVKQKGACLPPRQGILRTTLGLLELTTLDSNCGICDGLWMDFVYAVYGLCMYFGLRGIYDFRRGLSLEMRLALKQHYDSVF